MRKILKSCLLPISTLLCAFTHAQVPARENFNFQFENNYNNNQSGQYVSSDFVADWSRPVGSGPDGSVEIISSDASHQKAMRAYYPQGSIGPSSSHGFTWYSNLPTKTDEIYFSYDIMFKPGFEWVHGGKIPGIVGGSVTSGQTPTSSTGFSTRMMWKGGGTLVFYVYHHDQQSIYGDTYYWDGFQMQTGKWYNLTIRVVLNTINNGVAVSNGILEGYVDGKLLFQKTNFRFRLNETIKIDRMYLCSFFGGDTPEWNALRNEYIDFDNFVAYSYSSSATNVPRGLQPNTSKQLLHPYLNYTGIVPSVVVPTAPTSLSQTTTGTTSSVLRWNDNCSRESGFKIERKTGTGVYTQVAQVSSNNATYTDNTLSASTSYTYRVCAYNSAGNSSYSNECIVNTQSAASSPPPAGVTNIAFGKPSVQSATAYSGIASRANDNNTNGVWSSGSVSNTGNVMNPYWQVDLQGSYSLTNIDIWNRTDVCCVSRLTNYYVFVSDVPFTSADPVATKNQSGVWSVYKTTYPNPSTTIAVNRSGRYVRVQLVGQNELSIAEVKVFGSMASDVLNAPSNLVLQSAATTTSVGLKWTDNATNETGFKIERKTGSGAYTQIAQVPSNAVSYTDNSITAITSYTYRVYAYNATSNSAYSNQLMVQSPAEATGTIANLAYGKPSSQSSTAYSGIASRANDNNTNGLWSSNSVSNTGTATNPYWQVDLQGSYTLTNIELWNRIDVCCISRLTNYYVFVSNVPFTSSDPMATKNQSGVWSTFKTGYPNPSTAIPVSVTGRYVRIQIAGVAELSLAEVKVFGNTLKSLSGEMVALPSTEGDLGLKVFPNPSTNGIINIRFDMAENTPGSIRVYDMTGRLVYTIAEGSFTSGTNDFAWEQTTNTGAKAVPGIYMIKIAAGIQTSVTKVIISK